jgi:hypothetical protein
LKFTNSTNRLRLLLKEGKMNYAELVLSLTDHGKEVLLEQGVDESTIPYLENSDFIAMKLKFGDIAKIKRFIGRRVRGRSDDDDDDDEERCSRESRKKTRNAAELVEKGIIDDPLRLASMLPKNWRMGSIQALVQLWKTQFMGNPHLWEEAGFLGLLCDHLCVVEPSQRGSALYTLVWWRIVVWAAKVKGVGGDGDPAAQWGMRLVKETLSSDDTKLRLMMDFLGTPRSRPTPTNTIKCVSHPERRS